MSKKLFGKVFIFLLVVGLLFAVAPTGQAQAEGGTQVLEVGIGRTYTTLADAMAVVPTGLDEVTYVLYDDQTFTTTGHGTPDLAKGADVVNLKKAPTVTGEVKLTLAGVYYGTLNAIDAQFNVEGLTLINGRDKSGEGTDPWEFAYFEPDSASVTFKDCKFNHGVMVSIDATFDNCLFSRQPLTFPPDTADYSLNDYALWIHNFGDVLVKNSTFENFDYGGVKSTWNNYTTGADLTLTLQDNTFVNIGNGGEHTIANLDGAVSVTITGNLVIDSYTGGATTEQAALLEVDTIDPEPTIFVQNNIWAAPSVVYVDDGWASVPIGDDPDGTGPAIAMGYDAFATIQEGIAAVGAGGTVNVYDGVYNPPATITLDKAVSIIGPTTGEAKIIGAGGATNKIFNISTSDVTIQYLTFTLAVAPTAEDAMINATEGTAVGEEPKTNINILNNEIYVAPQAGAMSTWKAQAIYIGRETTASKVNGNTIYNTRSGLVVRYQSALEIKDNVIYNTKGGIMNYTGTVADADNRVMTGNSWGTTHNEWDIVWNSGGGPYVMDMDKYVLQLSIAQSDARVVSLMTTGVLAELTGNRSHVFVNATTGTTTIKADNGNINVPYAKIQDGINAVVPGGTVYVAAGTYAEQLTINKAVTLLGPNAGISAGVTPGMRVPEATVTFPTGLPIDSYLVSITSDNVTIDGLDFTYQEYLIALRPTLIGAEGVDNLTIVNNRFFGGEVAVEFVPTTTQPYSVALLIEDNYVDCGPFVNSGYNRGFYIYGTGGLIKNNVVLNTSIGIQILPHREPTGGTVEGNVVSAYSIGLYQNNHWADSGAWSWKDNTVTMALNDRLGLKAQVNLPYTADVTFRGVHLINYGIYGGTVPPVATFEGNSIDGASVGSVGVIGVDAIRINSTDSPFVPGTTATFRENSFINYTTAINNIAYGSTSVIVDAIENWWGSPCGPAPIIGQATVSPWYADAAMTTLATGVSGSYTFPDTATTAEINATIACAAPGSTLTFDGDYPGGIIIPEDRHHLTFNLLDETTITGATATDGYCFNVKGSYNRIQAETYAGATCIPTNGWPGIMINYMPTPWDNPLVDLVIDKLEIDGTDQTTGAGIWSAYFITDLQILNNYIHDLDAEAILLEDEPAGTFEVQGNMFLRTLGVADLTSHLINPNPYTFEYNSWGAYTVTDSITSAPGSIGPVDYTPWTHVELFANWVGGSSSWQDQVMKDETIVYSIEADLQHVTGAMFDLKYDPLKLQIVEVTPTTAFDPVPLAASVIDTSVDGVIHYDGWKLTQVSGEKVVLYTVKFKALQYGTTDTLDFDETTDLFSMTPLVDGVPSGSSTNIYAYLLNSKIVNLPALPVLDIEPVAGQDYVAGLPIEFNVTVTNIGGGNFDDLGLIYFDLPTGAVLEYCVGTPCVWTPIPAVFDAGTLLTGGTFDPVLPKIRVTFVDPGTNAISVKLMDQFPTTDYELARATETFVTLGNFTVTGTVWMQGRSWRGDVDVTLTVVSGFPVYGPRFGTSINQISNNLTILNVNGGTYELTTLQERYLNLYPENLKHIDVDFNELLNSLELKGGNAIWTRISMDHDNDPDTPEVMVDVINVLDAGMVGTWYGQIIDNDADCNFDGKVNIQDLALVGGNYNLTNLAAYGIGDLTWDPQP